MAAGTEGQGSMAEALMGKGAKYTAQLRGGQASDPKLHTLFTGTYEHLQLGRPITDASAREQMRLQDSQGCEQAVDTAIISLATLPLPFTQTIF
eukprot:1143115-Pelagomonas_calceolata.AAC.2